MQSTALGKETQRDRLLTVSMSTSPNPTVLSWQTAAKRDLKGIVPALAFPNLGKFVLFKAHFETWKHHGSFVLFPAKENNSTTKIRTQLFYILKQPMAEAQGRGRDVRGQPKVTGRIKWDPVCKAPQQSSWFTARPGSVNKNLSGCIYSGREARSPEIGLLSQWAAQGPDLKSAVQTFLTMPQNWGRINDKFRFKIICNASWIKWSH